MDRRERCVLDGQAEAVDAGRERGRVEEEAGVGEEIRGRRAERRVGRDILLEAGRPGPGWI